MSPTERTLTTAAVQSPELKNVYDGVAVLDAQGNATVSLPAWFDRANKDFRYQLTAIGAPGPNLYIAKEISGNHFGISGGKAGMKVSWQVTGVRNDPTTVQHPLQADAAKPADERGTYLTPEAYGQPASRGTDFTKVQRFTATTQREAQAAPTRP
jgi:hypothetical protein